MHPSIQISGKDRKTKIAVHDWPGIPGHPWHVSTVDSNGRQLEVSGWHRWEDKRPVGQLTVHVDGKRPLLITRYSLLDTLIARERAEALATLVSCAKDIAEDLGRADGCLEWQLEHHQLEDVCRLFPDFVVIKRRYRLRRGKRYLRICPDDR